MGRNHGCVPVPIRDAPRRPSQWPYSRPRRIARRICLARSWPIPRNRASTRAVPQVQPLLGILDPVDDLTWQHEHADVRQLEPQLVVRLERLAIEVTALGRSVASWFAMVAPLVRTVRRVAERFPGLAKGVVVAHGFTARALRISACSRSILSKSRDTVALEIGRCASNRSRTCLMMDNEHCASCQTPCGSSLL